MRVNEDTMVGDDYILLENTSNIYKTGSVWETRKCGDITIIGLLEKRRNVHFYLVQFEDGTLVRARHTNIKHGGVSNPYHYGNVCGVGCLGNTNSKHFLYKHWQQMLHRCYDENHIRYSDYGGRGIKVCKRWLCFEYFLEDITSLDGYEKLQDGRFFQLDRINNNNDYELDNCRIVNVAENCRNKRNNRFIKTTIDGNIDSVLCLSDASIKYNVDKSTILNRCKSNKIINGVEFVELSYEEYMAYENDIRAA